MFSADEYDNNETVHCDDEAEIVQRFVRESDGLNVFASVREAKKAKQARGASSMENNVSDLSGGVSWSAETAKVQHGVSATTTGAVSALGAATDLSADVGPPTLVDGKGVITKGYTISRSLSGGPIETVFRRLSGAPEIAPLFVARNEDSDQNAHASLSNDDSSPHAQLCSISGSISEMTIGSSPSYSRGLHPVEGSESSNEKRCYPTRFFRILYGELLLGNASKEWSQRSATVCCRCHLWFWPIGVKSRATYLFSRSYGS